MKRLRARQVSALIMAAMLALLLLRCGAEDRKATFRDPSPLTCPTVSELMPTVLTLLDEPEFDDLKAYIEELQVRPPGAALDPLHVLIGIVLDVLQSVDIEGLVAIIDQALLDRILDPFFPLWEGLFKYVAGLLPGHPPRYEVADVISGVLVGCQPSTHDLQGFTHHDMLNLLEQIINHPRIFDLFEMLERLLADPFVKSIIDTFTYSGCSSDAGCTGGAGFASFLDAVIKAVTHPDFENFDELLDLARFVPGLDLNQDPFPDLIALLEDVLDKDKPLYVPLTRFLRCLNRNDPRHLVYEMFYDLISLQEVDLHGLVASMNDMFDTDPTRLFQRFLLDVVAYFKDKPDEFRYFAQVVATIFKPSKAKNVVPVIVKILEEQPNGIRPINELLELLRAALTGCVRDGGP